MKPVKWTQEMVRELIEWRVLGMPRWRVAFKLRVSESAVRREEESLMKTLTKIKTAVR